MLEVRSWMENETTKRLRSYPNKRSQVGRWFFQFLVSSFESPDVVGERSVGPEARA